MAIPRPRPPRDGASSAAILSSGTDVDEGSVVGACGGPLKANVGCPNLAGPVELKLPNPPIDEVDPKAGLEGCPKSAWVDVDPKAGVVADCPKEDA